MKNNKVTQFVSWVVKRRWLVLLATIVLALSAGSGGQFLAFNNDYHIFFDDDNPQVVAFDGLQDKYTKDDNAFIVIAPKDGKVFTRETFSAVAELEQMAWQVLYSTRVDALTNFQHTRSVKDDMYVESLVSDIDNNTDSTLRSIEYIALNDPILLDRLVNAEGSVTALNVTVNMPMDSLNAPMDVMLYVRKMVKEWNVKYPEYDTYISGTVMLNGSFAELSKQDMGTLIPLMFLIILIMVFLTTGSLSSMLTSLFILIFSIMTAMGIAGWMGVELTGPSSSAPTMIMTLAIADSIHLLVTILQLMRKGMKKNDAIVESVRLNFMPVFITSVTTIIGFLTLNFAEGSPFHDLGNITAIGVAAAFVLSITLLPALVAIIPFKVKMREEKKNQTAILNGLANFIIGNREIVLFLSLLTVFGISYLSLKNELNNKFVEFFDVSVPFRSDTDFISDNLTGIYNLEYSLPSSGPDGISDPAYLKKLVEFEQWFKTQDEVVHVNSFAEIVKRVNASMHGDDQAYYKVPENRKEAAQFLLLYEMSLPYGLDLNNQINVDKSETRFTVTLKNISSNEMIALAARSEQWLMDNAPEAMFSHGISTGLMFSHITKTNMDSMLKGGFGALILISLILIFALRSLKYGIISLLPNVAPIAVAFGIWYLLVGEVSMAVTVVLGMTMGIVVDDTIHLLSKYIRARREMGYSAEDAVKYAFQTVGKAIIVTTVVLAAGFSVLIQSNFAFNSDMGKLTAITIITALVLDLLLLPALLLTIDKVKTKK
jgi:predicted RND superfamily exporter protein